VKWCVENMVAVLTFSISSLFYVRIFDPTNAAAGYSSPFNSACEGIHCVGDVELSIESNAIDFESDVNHPIFYRMVLFGGRGWSIFELPSNPDALLKLVFDSGDSVEESTCQYFPWAHNVAFDEKVLPAASGGNNSLYETADQELKEVLTLNNDPVWDGCKDQGDGTPGSCPMKESVDRSSAKDGAGIEEITVGVACGRLVTTFATEKSSIGLLFDITEITSPNLKKVLHLSPANQNKSAGLAYNDGDIGEIDPETAIFLTGEQSPSGRAGAIFVGVYSGTFSWWEFECLDEGSQTKNRDLRQSSSATSWGVKLAWTTNILSVAIASLMQLMVG